MCVSIVDVTSTQLFLSLARQFISALARLSNVCDRYVTGSWKDHSVSRLTKLKFSKC